MVHLGLQTQSTRARSDRQVASLLSGADRSVLESHRQNDKAAGKCRNLFDVYRAASHLQRKRTRRRVGATQEFTGERSCQRDRGFPVAHSLLARVRASRLVLSVSFDQLSRSPRINCSTQRYASSSVIWTGGCFEKCASG